MLLLGTKDGKFWWKREVSPGVWEFVAAEEQTRLEEEACSIFSRCAADTYAKFFKREEE